MRTFCFILQDLHSYDSKEETGMVGLKNQGATCYLNSLLQTLFHLRAFRQMVYETSTAQEDTNNSVSLALQRVFHRLQSQQKVVSTKELTRSFGWSAIDSFMQHDVQELYRILCDRLEEKMKHTKVDSAISKLFEGTVRSFVQCVNVDFQSFRDESFYDLQLDVKGCKDLMQSFRKYVEVEILDGDDQYDAEGHGKQDAKKGIEFASFPPVLNIQLKRFEYDAMRDGMVKVHDRFEFPKVLILDEFIAHSSATKDTNEKSPRYVYHLHSVLVHSGDVHGGHYYVFIRPGKHTSSSTSWFKFDDDQITRVDERIAIEGNFGSGGTPVTPQGGSTESPSPLHSSSIFGPSDINAENANEPGGMDGLEFTSVAAPGEPGTGGGSAADEGYEYSQYNDTSSIPLRPSSSTQMLPLGRSFSSAYMLVYVRNGENDISAIQEGAFVDTESITTTPCASKKISAADHLLNSIKTEVPPIKPEIRTWESDPVSIPTELVTRFHEEEKAVSRRKKAQQTEHLYINLRIASDTSIAKLRRITKTMDFSGFNNSNTLRIRIKRTASIRQLYRRVYKETGVPMLRQRLWKVITRENRTTRPDQPLGPDLFGCRVDWLIEDDASHKAPVRLYLQILSSVPKSPPSPSSPSIYALEVEKSSKIAAPVIHRHFWDEFTPPEIENKSFGTGDTTASQGTEDGDEDAAIAFAPAGESIVVDHAPALQSYEIVLFIKFYDPKRKLGERLEYVGNVVVDSRITGAELAKYLHDALSLPIIAELLLYEEVQSTSVSEIDMESTLTGSEIQNGDIICFQYAANEDVSNCVVINPGMDDDLGVVGTTYIGPDGEEMNSVICPDSEDNLAHTSSLPNLSARYHNGNQSPHSHGLAKVRQPCAGKLHQHQRQLSERYPDVPSYFQYLLDRVEVTFHRYGHSEEESFTLSLLFSNVYDEVIDAVASHLGLLGPKRLFVRLYQHSPLNNLPMKSPLRHSRYAEDDQTTLEELLTEYMERTNILYYELLSYPITEIEAKKELLVHLSIYDACFATEEAASPSPVSPQRHIEVLVKPTHTVRDLLKLIRKGCRLPEDTPLRACETVQHGTMITRLIQEDVPLQGYWGQGAVSDPHSPEILVEQIPMYEINSDNDMVDKQASAMSEHRVSGVASTEVVTEGEMSLKKTETAHVRSPRQLKDVSPDDDEATMWYYKGVVHFNFQNTSQKLIHPHGVPCVVRFSERDTVGAIKERIRQRMGISFEVFAQWNFALVKDLKASTLQNVYDEMEPEALDAFPMSRLTELCGADFEHLGSLGLEHADPTPVPRHHSTRRLETGIHIRQS
uniref:ubiquitinyl hydrolase 1 n=1 Tax=Peronospora matthiolae TaxID=2874970 RepID=A0AAV1U0R9_9STRA